MTSPTIFIAPLSQWLTLEETLTTVLNRGYNKPRVKYGVLLTPRIKYGIVKDFDLKAVDDAQFAICLAPQSSDIVKVDSADDSTATTSKIIRSFPLGSLDLSNIDTSESLETVFKAFEDGTLQSRILGTICVKKFRDLESELEITGLTSFYPGLSPKLMDFMEVYSKNKLKTKTLWVDAIEEHDLLPYYEKLGFLFVSRVTCKIDPETRLVKGSTLEDGILAAKDFHVILMKKDI
ncbi:DEKNAAC103713 [Brettanomyces naardenensis]|uniref:DEKNAAC103713 n=1 Tax=Brettanomyces naardenensis TaxID=13370 RepID=A0A448YNP7_BRENA|nr:DEKNAAC103713 [Brettanomyces naardenensis]